MFCSFKWNITETNEELDLAAESGDLSYTQDTEASSCKKGIFRNFAKFIGKHMCQSLVFNIFAGWGEISKKTFSYRTSALAASENMQDTDDEKFQIHQTLIFPTIRRVYDGYDDSELNNEANEQLGFCRDKTATLWKKRLWHRCFPVKFVKFLRSQNNFFSWNRKILSFFT